ncbi:MAG: clostripain-related cysteine peptidase [Faecalibacterium sp.]
MFCKMCGCRLDGDANFCTECGTRVKAPVPPVAPVQQPIAPAPDVVLAQQPAAPVQQPSAPVPPVAPSAQGGCSSTGNTAHSTVQGGYAASNEQTEYRMDGIYNTMSSGAPLNIKNWAKPVPKRPKPKWLVWLILGIVLLFVAQFVGCCVWLFSDDEGYDDYGTGQGQSSGFWDELYETSEGNYGEELEIDDLRDFYTTVKGDGSDEITLMVYMLGSDLESDGGSASEDIEEMLAATYGDNLNVVMMTGGATNWSNRQISSSTCQYWQLTDGELVCLEKDLGRISMVSEDILADFIQYAQATFPANRYGIILWDHGGGTFSGFGYDEYYPNDTLTLENLSNAFAAGGVQFDFIGFDACLMATAETAFALEPYADYLIASEETEPATGWAYTEWLTLLGKDTSMSTVDLGVAIVDSYIESLMRFEEGTLSVIELRQMPYTYMQLCDYFSDASDLLNTSDYRELSIARSNVKDFGESEFDQVDVIDFATEADLDGSESLIAAVDSAVKYYSNTSAMSDTYGMAMYFPYDYPEYYSEIQAVLESVGYTADYTSFFSQFISAMVGGQTSHGRSSGSESTVDYSNESWYDADVASSYEASYDTTFSDQLVIVEKGDTFVLQLSDAQWEDITMIELQVLLDDGDGYIDLGSDNVYEFDRDGDLLIEFDYTWVTLDGQTVPFYAEKEEETSDGGWYTYGSVPAVLNGEEYIEVIVYWDDENPSGYVAGYRQMTQTGDPVGKGLFTLSAGDTLEWLFDYYDYELYYQDTYVMGDLYTVTGSEIEVSYADVGNQDAYVYFVLTDLFNISYNTEAVVYTDY